jgi:hypothetical protein
MKPLIHEPYEKFTSLERALHKIPLSGSARGLVIDDDSDENENSNKRNLGS